jgi:hypothetical protein
MNGSKEYQCQKCKTRTWSEIPHVFCICGGKLLPAFSMKDVEEIFPWLREDKK